MKRLHRPIRRPLPEPQRRVLTAMMQGKALVGGQLEGEWVKTQVLRALCDQQLVTVDVITRVYHLTEQGRERASEGADKHARYHGVCQ